MKINLHFKAIRFDKHDCIWLGLTDLVVAVHYSLVFALSGDEQDFGYGCGAWTWLCRCNPPVCLPGGGKVDLHKQEEIID